MANIHIDSPMSDDLRRQLIYAGDLFLLSPTPASVALCELANDMLIETFVPHDPEIAQLV